MVAEGNVGGDGVAADNMEEDTGASDSDTGSCVQLTAPLTAKVLAVAEDAVHLTFR